MTQQFCSYICTLEKLSHTCTMENVDSVHSSIDCNIKKTRYNLDVPCQENVKTEGCDKWGVHTSWNGIGNVPVLKLDGGSAGFHFINLILYTYISYLYYFVLI